MYGGVVPLSLVFCEDLALGVVAHDLGVNEATQIQLFGSEHRHVGGMR